MSTTSIKNSFVVTESTKDYRKDANDSGEANQEPPLLEILSLTGWRKLVLETLAFLAVITLLQHLFPGNGEIPGLPHPYWIPVLLASCQYGVTGGAIATVAASVVYFLELSPPTASQDFYTYAGIVTVQPAAWLATALVLGGLRNLHIHQSRELADQLAASRGRANDLSNGLERAAVEINALERRIAIDMGSVAALSRAFSQLNMSDRRSAALSYGELFHVGTGTPTFIVYLRVADRYVPVWAVEDDTVCSINSMEVLSLATIRAMLAENTVRDAGEGEPGGRYVVRVPPSHVGSEPLAAIVCVLHPSQDARQFRLRSDELSCSLAIILSACPDSPPGARL
jgi:hypothetical protein